MEELSKKLEKTIRNFGIYRSISDYFSKVLLNSDKDEYTKKEEKELRRLKYKLVRMDK